MKQKASSLLYSLFILIIIGSLLTIIIFLFGISKKNVYQLVQSSNKSYDLQSGFNILLSSKSLVPIESSQLLDLFNEGTNNVLLERYQWGLLEFVGASIPDSSIKHSKYALIANTIGNDQQFYLVDNNSPLSLAGQTELHGNCFLPKKGVERAYLTNSPYVGTQLVYGNNFT